MDSCQSKVGDKPEDSLRIKLVYRSRILSMIISNRQFHMTGIATTNNSVSQQSIECQGLQTNLAADRNHGPSSSQQKGDKSYSIVIYICLFTKFFKVKWSFGFKMGIRTNSASAVQGAAPTNWTLRLPVLIRLVMSRATDHQKHI